VRAAGARPAGRRPGRRLRAHGRGARRHLRAPLEPRVDRSRPAVPGPGGGAELADRVPPASNFISLVSSCVEVEMDARVLA